MGNNYMICKGIDLFFENSRYANLLTIDFDGKTRTFCRCGEVYLKRTYRCGICDKYGNHYYSCDSGSSSYYGRRYVLFAKYRMDKTPKGFNIIKENYKCVANKTTEEFEIVKDSEEVEYSKDLNGITLSSTSMNWYSTFNTLSLLPMVELEEIKKNDKTYFEGFENFKFIDFPNQDVLKNPLAKYILYCYFRKAIPWLFDGENCLNDGFFSYLFYDLANFSKYKSYNQFIKNKSLEDFEKYLKASWFYKGMRYERDFVTNSILTLDKSYKDLLLYYFEHYKISYLELNKIGLELNNAINRLQIERNDDEIFIKFLKDNLIIYKQNIVNKYLEMLEWLNKLKLTRTTENIRNINFLKNQHLIAEMGYPEMKTSIFMDSFYDNPLKASYYLKSKKELTKKEVDDFIEAQTK